MMSDESILGQIAFEVLQGHMDGDAESAVGNSSLNFNSRSELQTHPWVSFTECHVRHGDCVLREQDTEQNPGFVNIQVSAGRGWPQSHVPGTCHLAWGAVIDYGFHLPTPQLQI